MTEPQLDARAGRYVRQATGYAAFIPTPLPPEPPVRMDDELLKLLSDADRALGRLDGVAQILPDTDLFLAMYVRKEAVYSSQIEGTQASLDDVVAFEEAMEEADNPDDVEEVLNYVTAINYGRDRLHELPVSLRLIRELHGVLMQGVRGRNKHPGEFRTSQNWIGPAGATLRDALFVPPPPDVLLDHLGAFEKFLHEPSNLPVLIQVGLAHAQFETIHPFLDGNGRLGRLLITFLLCEKEILAQPALYISHYFRARRNEYYDRLQAVRDEGDWEGWLKFFLTGVRQTALEATKTASQIMQLRERHRALIAAELTSTSAGNATQLLEHLFRAPSISINKAAEILGRSYPIARELVRKLASLGILEESTGKTRYRRFRYAPYLALFRDQPIADR